MLRFCVKLLTLSIWILSGMRISQAAKGIETTQIVAVVNRTVELPCDTESPLPDDKTIIILWYRENWGNPIYIEDLREQPQGGGGAPAPPSGTGAGVANGADIANAAGSAALAAAGGGGSASGGGGGGIAKRDAAAIDDLQNRTFFRSTAKSPAYLHILGVTVSDEGVYRCRVDFKKAPTRNSNINVTVIVPPTKPTIMDEKGMELGSTVGPYNEGSSLILSCESGAGKPPPHVTWWRESTMLDDGYEVTSVGMVRNDLLVPSLTRDDFLSVYRCESTNNNMTEAVFTEVTVDMNLKPLEVRILQEKTPLSAEKRYLLVCRSSGSRPPPIMAWWMGNRRMKKTEDSLSQDGNVTTSTLKLIPYNEDNGKFLSCRAENPTIPQSGMEDGWKLDIHYAPIMSLKLGSSLKDDNIKETDDVYFECNIRANPWVHTVEWKFKGEHLSADANAGIIISNQSLVIQKVKRANAGEYTCVGVNSEGDGESLPIDLMIKHIPVCKEGQKMVYSVARNEIANVVCELDTNPKEVEFKWAFNKTTESVDSAKGRVTVDLAKSVLFYTPRNEKDYGTLYCWGSNEMGVQKTPCAFTVIAAGPPDPVHNCSVHNRSETALFIRCRPGYDGGLNQTFFLELYDSLGTELVKSTVKQGKPEFLINGLQAGMHFAVSVFATNDKGRSVPLALTASTVEAAHQSSDSENIFAVTPILGVLIGIVATFTLVAIAIVVVMKFRASSNSKRKEYEQEPTDRSNVPLRKDTDDGGENEEKSPDVIPSNNDHEFPPVEVKCLQKFNSSGTLERKCDNCRSAPPYGAIQPEQINHSWNQSKKVRPYEEMQYIEMQTPGGQCKMPPPPPLIRRDSGSHGLHCSVPERGFPHPPPPLPPGRRYGGVAGEDDDVTCPETPLMKCPAPQPIVSPLSVATRLPGRCFLYQPELGQTHLNHVSGGPTNHSAASSANHGSSSAHVFSESEL